jgi:MraZ protein
MEPNEQIEPTTPYNSSFQHGVDEKRRLQIPAKWRPAEPGFEFTLVLWPASPEGPCLRGLPPSQLKVLMRKIEARNSDASKVALKRYLGSQSVQVTLDKVGRICLPDGMARAAGITDQAVLVGLFNQFEIWNPERYEKVKVSDAVMAQEASQLLE